MHKGREAHKMARLSSILTWLTLLVIALFSLSSRFGVGASPTVKSDVPPKPHEITGKLAAPSAATTITTTTTVAATKAGVKQARANTAEKLKRGLTNFMNHLNPAPYFVPTSPLAAGGKLTTGSQAEPATIINDAPSADVLIKGPNRLVQARPLGGPLRWGR